MDKKAMEELYRAIFGEHVDVYPYPRMVVTKMTAEEAVGACLASLQPREQNVLCKRFGLDGNGPQTLRQIGRTLPRRAVAPGYPPSGQIGVNPERVRQIESKALRKLRHPSRRLLKLFFGLGYYRNRPAVIEAAIRELQEELAIAYREQEQGQLLEALGSIRLYHLLPEAGITSIEQLRPMSKDELMKIRGIGQKTAQEIIETLERL